MNWHHLVLAATASLTLLMMGTSADAQGLRSAAATADDGHPADISSGKTDSGLAYTDSRGMTLYSMNLRYVSYVAQGGDALKYCSGECAKSWIAAKAPADAKPIGPWKVVDGTEGPQWSYKGDPLFTYAGDSAPGSTGGKDRDNLFNLLTYIPPVPRVTAPAPVKTVFVGEAYILEDGQGHALFTIDESCGADCRNWIPFAAGMASRSIGDWKISREGDRLQWEYRGRLVYVSQEEQPTRAPSKGTVLVAVPALAQAGKPPERVAALPSLSP
jgi:predicted lipoprotein with Yx(FWY)xxD motif